MWLENLRELRKKSGMSIKQIADKSILPERTVNRIFAGESDHPYADTLDRIVKAMGDYDLGDIFSDTNVVVVTESLVETKEVVEEVEAERDDILIKYESLAEKTIAQETEIRLLREEISRIEARHKDDLLALVKYFTNVKTGE